MKTDYQRISATPSKPHARQTLSKLLLAWFVTLTVCQCFPVWAANSDLFDFEVYSGVPGDSGASHGFISTPSFNNVFWGGSTGSDALATDASGNVYVADVSLVRRMTPDGTVTTLAGRYGNAVKDGVGGGAGFSILEAIAVDGMSNIYVADNVYWQNYPHGQSPFGSAIRKITLDGTVTTFAGDLSNIGSVDGQGNAARFRSIRGLAIDASGNLYAADSGNQTIRKISPNGKVETLMGIVGKSGTADGNDSTAKFNDPRGLAVDQSGTIYVADFGNHAIRKISGGIVSTFAGVAGVSGDVDGVGQAARFANPAGIALAGNGNLWVTDNGSRLIRIISPNASVATGFGKLPDNSRLAQSDGYGTNTSFRSPSGLAIHNDIVYVYDYDLIRKITPEMKLSSIAGGGLGRDGVGVAAGFSKGHLTGLAFDPKGNAIIADGGTRVRKGNSLAGVD